MIKSIIAMITIAAVTFTSIPVASAMRFEKEENPRRYIAMLRRYVNRMPGCKANLTRGFVVKNLPPIKIGGRLMEPEGLAHDNFIEFSNKIYKHRMEHVAAHECGHIVDTISGYTKAKLIFGKPPFVSDYASTNKFEDFAETYAHYLLYGDAGSKKKERVMADILANLGHETVPDIVLDIPETKVDNAIVQRSRQRGAKRWR